MDAGSIIVDFIGRRFGATEHQQLSFGRTADVELDTNRHLPRVVGRLRSASGLWWLHNECSTLSIQVDDRNSSSRSLIAPGSASPVVFTNSTIRVVAGRAVYELELSIDSGLVAPFQPQLARIGVDMSEVPLNDDQRALLLALAESRLLNPHGPPNMPTNAELAARLGWRMTKLNRKLDNLCAKFDKLGVPGLRGSPDRLATDRRQRLADFCVGAEIVTIDDLEVPGGEQPAA